MEYLFTCLAFSRALFISPVRKSIESWLEFHNIIAPFDFAIPIFSFLLVTVLFLLRPSNIKDLKSFAYLFVFVISLSIVYLISGWFGGNGNIFWVGTISCVLAPPVCATLLKGKEKNRAMWLMLNIFFIYLTINLIYWAYYLLPMKEPSTGVPYYRLGGTLAFTVNLGPLIPAVLSFYTGFVNRTKMKNYIFVFSLSLVSVFACASRLGIFCFIVFILMLASDKTKIPRSSKVIIMIVLMLPLAYFANRLSEYRFFKLSIMEEGRFFTWSEIANYIFSGHLSGIDILFGKGWGSVFPYWEWVSKGGKTWGGQNLFFLNDNYILVSPHNSFLWILLEGGSLLMLVLCIILIKPLLTDLKSRKLNIFYILGSLFIFLMLLTDDILITAPGTAFFGLMLMFLAFAQPKMENCRANN